MAVPKLMEYICLVNPSETSKASSPDNSPTARGRMLTDIDKSQSEEENAEDSLERTNDKTRIDMTKGIKRPQKHLEIDRSKVSASVAETIKLFRFKSSVRKSTVFSKQKKETITSLTKDKSNSEYERSPTITLFDESRVSKRAGTFVDRRRLD
jgi:DNA-directed RNA polymerase alpha subunit